MPHQCAHFEELLFLPECRLPAQSRRLDPLLTRLTLGFPIRMDYERTNGVIGDPAFRSPKLSVAGKDAHDRLPFSISMTSHLKAPLFEGHSGKRLKERFNADL